MNNAYLLGRDGTIIPVLNHPSADFEFESVLRVLTEYMDDDAKELAGQYINNPSESTKESILKVYTDYWCKVRSWDSNKLITFRIGSNYDAVWHNTIVKFLVDHPCYKDFKVTVESDKSVTAYKAFWDEVPYEEAILSTYDNSMVVTIYLKPLIYTDSSFLCKADSSIDTSGKCINGSWSEYGEQLENPVENEWNHYIQDCEFLMSQYWFKLCSSMHVKSDIEQYKAFYVTDNSITANLTLNLELSDNPFDDSLPENVRTLASDYLQIRNILNGTAAEAGIGFVIEKVQVGSATVDSWVNALKVLEKLLVKAHITHLNSKSQKDYSRKRDAQIELISKIDQQIVGTYKEHNIDQILQMNRGIKYYNLCWENMNLPFTKPSIKKMFYYHRLMEIMKAINIAFGGGCTLPDIKDNYRFDENPIFIKQLSEYIKSYMDPMLEEIDNMYGRGERD